MLGIIVVIGARWHADAMTMQSPLCTPAVTAGMTVLADSHAGLEPHRWAGGTAVRSSQTEVMTWRRDDGNWGRDGDRGGGKDDRRDFSDGGYGSGSGKVSSPEWALPA